MEFENLSRYFFRLLTGIGVPEGIALFLNITLNLLIIFAVAYIFSKLLRIVLVKIFQKAFSRSETLFDDYFIENGVFIKLTNLIMLFIVKAFVPLIFVDFPNYIDNIETFLNILILFAIIRTIKGFFNTIKSYLKTLDTFRNKPVDSYVQVIMLFVWFVGFILLFSMLTGETPWEFLTALGAVSAVIMLIFKDTILGFVASIQISINDTVRIGDWITMEKFGADGDVIEINLSIVRIRNFDNTITSVPTYYLNSEAFTNWRGMQELGGRRIKRPIIIQISCVRFLSIDEIEKLKKIDLLKNYIDDWLEKHRPNKKNDGAQTETTINNRNLTNLGVFRKYVNLYLEQHSKLRPDFSMMGRLLDPTPQGIPLQIYAFTNTTSWVPYEDIAGDIFEHLLAAVPHFYLQSYELLPSDKIFQDGDEDPEETDAPTEE